MRLLTAATRMLKISSSAEKSGDAGAGDEVGGCGNLAFDKPRPYSTGIRGNWDGSWRGVSVATTSSAPADGLLCFPLEWPFVWKRSSWVEDEEAVVVVRVATTAEPEAEWSSTDKAVC